MPTDELDDWLAAPLAGTPLHREAQAALDRMPVNEDDVRRLADRAGTRIRRSERPRWRTTAAVVSLLAAAALFAVWPRAPERPELTFTVAPAPLGDTRAEVDAATDPEALAARWAANGRATDAVEVYRWLLADDPMSPDAARWQGALVEALTVADPEAAWVETLALRDRYGAGSSWAAHWGTSDIVETTLRGQAGHWHRQAMKTESAETLDRAGVAYETYLADWPAGPNDAEVRYGYGELLYRANRLDEAWEQYHAVVREHPDSARAKFCAASAVQAAEQLAGDSVDGGPLGVWDQRLIVSTDDFSDQYPDEPRAAILQYRAAFLLRTHGDAVAAREHFDRVIAIAPTSREAPFAANLILDDLGAEKAWAQIATRAQSWLDAGWPDADLRAELEAWLVEAARHR